METDVTSSGKSLFPVFRELRSVCCDFRRTFHTCLAEREIAKQFVEAGGLRPLLDFFLYVVHVLPVKISDFLFGCFSGDDMSRGKVGVLGQIMRKYPPRIMTSIQTLLILPH